MRIGLIPRGDTVASKAATTLLPLSHERRSAGKALAGQCDSLRLKPGFVQGPYNAVDVGAGGDQCMRSRLHVGKALLSRKETLVVDGYAA